MTRSGWTLSPPGDSPRWTLPENTPTPSHRAPVSGQAAAVYDSQAIALELKRRIKGEVRFDNSARALYATDSSNYRQTPIGVVIPKDADDVAETIAICKRFNAPILSRGGGTSLAGQCCNIAVIMDMSKYMNQVLELDVAGHRARVQPGTILDELKNPARAQGVTFGPDPATHNHCTLGGMIGNNSCGSHAQMAGRTVDNVDELEILTYDGARMRVGATSELEFERIIREGGRKGEIYSALKEFRDKYADLIRARYPKIPRRVSGYSIDELLPENGFNVARALVGSQSTCVTILEATLRLVDWPQKRVILVLGYEDIYTAGDQVSWVNPHKPLMLEGLDDLLIEGMRKKNLHTEYMHLLPKGKGWLVIEFGADTHEGAVAKAEALILELQTKSTPFTHHLLANEEDQLHLAELRESGLGATAFVPGEKDAWEGWEDSAVPPDQVGPYLRDLRKIYDKYDYKAAFYGHFGHGCIHIRTPFDLLTVEGVQKWRSFMNEAVDLCVRYGGSLSGEHGDGQNRAEFLPRMFGEELVQAFREFKAIWDPLGKMNPGKVVDSYRHTENLRLGVDYNPAQFETHFKYPDDQGSLARATLRCVGVGKCRRTEGGTMCPSFMVTREEKDSTRGRAHLLHEMLTGDVLEQSWKSEEVKDSLDLCLACKGCKSDCPVNVDMATYKAEFLSHYYEGRIRPRVAYAMGLIDVWAKWVLAIPGLAWLVNFLGRTPGLNAVAKAVAGIAPERKIPQFAEQTFKRWFKRRGPRQVRERKVILWADTFSNHFHPEVAIAATEVLEAAGFEVIVPEQHLCCGRPLYDFGMLDRAKRYLKTILTALKSEIRAGIPLVALEPSCFSVFKDELKNLFPNDLDALRLHRQAYLLGDFLEKYAPDYVWPELKRKAVIHGHCHQKSTTKLKGDDALLRKLGIDFKRPASGCCGMAGSFGFEKENDHYGVSMKIGEMSLLPAVRGAGVDELVMADGFSCKTQIEQGTGRKALHLAQVLKMALNELNE